MRLKCPYNCPQSFPDPKIKYFGRYYRSSDRKWVQRFKCAICRKHFSSSTLTLCYKQKKRHINSNLLKLLVAGVSQRKAAKILKVRPSTVARKLAFLGEKARRANFRMRNQIRGIDEIQFDDMETFEHTKLKPVSITLAVEKHSRYIIGFEVSRMSAKGPQAKRAIMKYGPRADERHAARIRLFRRIKNHISPYATIESDENPHYSQDVANHFPHCIHKTYLGARGAITGQGELKKTRFDPLFSLNHTCAMFRYSASRLIRRSWCTTKKIQPLIDHLEIYTFSHNKIVTSKKMNIKKISA